MFRSSSRSVNVFTDGHICVYTYLFSSGAYMKTLQGLVFFDYVVEILEKRQPFGLLAGRFGDCNVLESCTELRFKACICVVLMSSLWQQAKGTGRVIRTLSLRPRINQLLIMNFLSIISMNFKWLHEIMSNLAQAQVGLQKLWYPLPACRKMGGAIISDRLVIVSLDGQ